MRENHGDLFQRQLLRGDQVGAHREVVLPDDLHRAGLEGERVERGTDRALDRVLEGDQSPIGLAVFDGDDRVVDAGGSQCLEVPFDGGFAEGVLGEGARGTQVGDSHARPPIRVRPCRWLCCSW